MLKTAEAVSPKHPDKICDRISDAILDYCLINDENSRVAIETMGGHGKVYITGEISSNFDLNYDEIKKIIYRISNIDDIFINIVKQSNFIANGVDIGGAGDQGIMVGYACSENVKLIPKEIYLAKDLCKFIYDKYKYDGKSQITIDDKNNIVSLVLSFQNVSSIKLKELADEWLIDKNKADNLKTFFNPAGDWNIGGLEADTGLTGRKIICDNYGPQIPVGGGAFSGKDSTKVDRSGAYIARKIAIDILKKYNAKNVLIKIAYAIGVVNPVMVTALINNEKEIDITNEYDLSPKNIIKILELKKPIFEKVAEWGSFGNDFIWDK